MIGSPLSRWTLAYFACALACLMAALALMAAGFGFPAQSWRDPRTLILVHLVAVGWLSLLMTGALLQFTPVLTARKLACPGLSGPALLISLAGLAALLTGFAALAGAPVGGPPWLPLGGAGLLTGFGLNLFSLILTCRRAAARPLPVLFVLAGLAAFAGAASLGFVFTLLLQGWTASPYAAALLTRGLPLHAALGLGGWLTFAAMGVSYRLLSMFMLSPESERRTTRLAFALGTAALAVLLIAGPVIVAVAARRIGLVLLAAAALSLACLALYGWDVAAIYRRRNRRRLELNSRMARWALGALGIAAAAIAVFTATGWSARAAAFTVFVAAMGWLSGLGLSQAYKIVAFITWLEVYGPMLGKRPAPQVAALTDEPRALPWFRGYYVAVAICAVAILMGQAGVFRVAALTALACVVMIAAELIRIRRLRYAAARDDAPRPRLFLVQSSR